MIKKIYCLIIISHFFLFTLYSQISRVRTITNQNWVNAACTDADTLWIATMGGLVQYLTDGSYLKTHYSTNGLRHNTVTAIAVDSNGYLWAGSKSGGVSNYDGKAWNEFFLIGGPQHEVYTIYRSSDDKLWFGTWADGVRLWTGGSWINYKTNNSGLVNDYVHSIAEDADGKMWFGTQNGISSFDGNNWESFNEIEGTILSIEVDENNNKWFASWFGFSRYNNSSWTHYTKDDYPVLESGDILSMSLEGDTVWLGTYYNGVRFISPDTIGNYTSENSPLTSGRVQNIFIDDNGNKYFSTGDLLTDGGVARLNSEGWKIFQPDSPLPPSLVMSICKESPDIFWMGTYGGGVSRYSKEEWVKYNAENSTLRGEEVNSIVADSSNNIWFGTDGGISKYKDGEWQTTNMDDELAKIKTYDLCVDMHNNLWAATSQGLVSFDGRQWLNYNAGNSQIVSDDLYRVAVDSGNNVWAGSFDNGLSKFDGNAWTNYNMKPGKNIEALEVDNDNNIWVAVQSHGIYRFDGEEWINLNTANSGLQLDFISSIAFDPDGSVWFGALDGGSGGGLSVFDGESWEYYDIDNSDLVDNGINDIFFDKNDIWLGTNFGVSVFTYDFASAINIISNNSSEILVYPNPADKYLNINLNSFRLKRINLSLYDINGRPVYRKNYVTSKIQLDISDMKGGLYILNIESEGGLRLYSTKILIL